MAARRIALDGDRLPARTGKARYEHVAFFQSASTPNKTYEVKYDKDERELKCNCPGWIFKRKDRPRGCKHLAQAGAAAVALDVNALGREAIANIAMRASEVRQNYATVAVKLIDKARRLIVLDD